MGTRIQKSRLIKPTCVCHFSGPGLYSKIILLISPLVFATSFQDYDSRVNFICGPDFGWGSNSEE